jgi:hypothetical protein
MAVDMVSVRPASQSAPHSLRSGNPGIDLQKFPSSRGSQAQPSFDPAGENSPTLLELTAARSAQPPHTRGRQGLVHRSLRQYDPSYL